MRILSIDWDYFFPPSQEYDWGAHEDNPIFHEVIWYARCNARNIITREHVLDEYIPTIPDTFWNIVTNNPPMVVSNSHLGIWPYIKDNRDIYLTNIDAHHDCGYGTEEETKRMLCSRSSQIDCSNWGLFGCYEHKIRQFIQVYPLWRSTHVESWESSPKSSAVGLVWEEQCQLPMPKAYDLVFVCRSSCWTPPWYDTRFSEFLDESGLEYEFLDRLVQRERSPDLEEAKMCAENMDRMTTNFM